MANCCETIDCNKMVDMDVVNEFTSEISKFCSNYTGTTYSPIVPCCTSGQAKYVLTYKDLQSGFTQYTDDNYWTDASVTAPPKDGVIVQSGEDISDCCTGHSCVALKDFGVGYYKDYSFTVTGSVSGTCDEVIGEPNFNYSVKRYVHMGCENVTEEDITFNRESNVILGRIISAVTLTSSSSAPEQGWIDFSSFNSTSLNGITVTSTDIFAPSFDTPSVTTGNCSDSNCKCCYYGQSDGSTAYMHIKSMFRGCNKDDSYKITRDNASFTLCFSSDLEDKMPSSSGNYTNVFTFTSGEDEFSISSSRTSVDWASLDGRTLTVQENDGTSERSGSIDITVRYCNEEYPFSCDFTQSGGEGPTPPPTPTGDTIEFNCCTGMVSLFPSLDCGDSFSV